jgi:hypothetical protein
MHIYTYAFLPAIISVDTGNGVYYDMLRHHTYNSSLCPDGKLILLNLGELLPEQD